MDISGKINVFPREVGQDKIKIFETSISHKDEEGNYVDSYTLRLNFPKEALTDEQKAKFNPDKYYKMQIEGFLSTRGWDDKEGKHHVDACIVVSRLKLLDKGTPMTKKPKQEEDFDNGVDIDNLPW